MTACVIYTRYSPRRNADESVSCETQEALCREHAEAQGWTVRSVHSDAAASAKEGVSRPAFDAALAELEKGDVLLVWRWDRIARSVLLSELTRRQLRAAGATAVAVEGDVVGGDSPEAVFVRQVLDAVAELERKLIGARTRSTMRSQQRRGKRVGRYAPYGWRVDPEDPTRLKRDMVEAAAVARIRQLAAEGLSPCQIARRMDEEHPGACRGESWHHRTVRKILDRA